MNPVDLKPPAPQRSVLPSVQATPAMSARSADSAQFSFQAFMRVAEIGPSTEQADPRSEFALRSDNADHSLHGRPSQAAIDLQGQPLPYKGEVVIGETAVAFNSRPIVGPARFTYQRTDVARFLLEPAHVSGQGAVQLSLEAAVLNGPLRIDGTIGSFATELAVTRPGRSSRVTGAPVAVAAMVEGPHHLAGSPTGFIGSIPSRPGSAEPVADRPSATTGSAPAPRYSLSFANPAFAQLIASPSEYRLIIRGQAISENERDQLLGELALMLGAFGLPFHPVQLVLPHKGS